MKDIKFLQICLFRINKIPIYSALEFLTKSKFENIKPVEFQILKLAKYHQSYNPLYKKKCHHKLNKISDLPIMQKKDFQQSFDKVISAQYKLSDCYRGSTSGSSGNPFQFVKDKMAHALTWANIILEFKNLGISIFDYQARFYGIPKTIRGNLQERIKDKLLRRYRFNVFDLSDKAMNIWLSLFSNKNFVYINGYTSAITLFARFCLNKNLILKDICKSLELCIVTSETCTIEDKVIIEKAFGVPVVREYGASEIDLIAMEGLDGIWRICESNVYVEVVDDNGKVIDDGSEGRLLVTSLHNKAMPFIRYEIGDRGILGRSSKGERLLVALTGRTNDFIILPSGKRAAGLTFYYISRSLLENGGILKEFIIRQKKIDIFEFDVVAERNLNNLEIRAIQLAMDKYLEPGLRLIINYVDLIERNGSGKIKHFFSEIDL